MRFDPMNRLLRRAALALGAVLAAGLLAACGGEGAGAGGSAAGTTGTTASDILLFSDKVSLPGTDGSTSATITAQVKDASNNVVRNQRVVFSTSDSGVALSPVGTTSVTDSAGRMQVTLDLGSTAAARANRVVTVTATSGKASATTTVQVVGTRVSVVGPDSLTVGASSEYTIAAVDATGAGVASLPVTVTFAGGTPASSALTTGANGQVKVTLTGVTPGASAVVATAAGIDPVSRAVNVLGSNTPFRVLSPADGSEVLVNTDQPITVQFQENGAPAAGRTIVVTTTRGTVNGSTSANVVTNANGEVTANVRSASAGQATITATVFSGGTPNSVSSRINYVSRTPSKITLSLDPSSIGANAPGSTSSTSRLITTVRDATDNPVKGALVTFAAQDPSNGSIQPSTAVTDASGQAIASFIAGPTSSSAVQISASVFNASGTLVATDSKTMTVSAVALFVELGTGNSIEALDATTYSMPWTAIVTDANRNPVSGLPVTVSLTAVSYFKGIWAYSGSSWSPVNYDNATLPLLKCASEDTNRNNLLDAGEDINTNGRLDPGSPASVRVTTADGKTAADGRATLAVIYPKSFGEWVEVTMRVTIGTPGTESSISRTFVVPVLAADVTSATVAPPNVNARTPPSANPANALVGPYGYVQDCTNPN
jgi:hypothetical protein